MTDQHHERDHLATRWLPLVLLWVLPPLAIVASGLAGVLMRWIWPLAFGVMGIACVLNAVRCRRLHCFFTGPIFLTAAVLSALHGWGLLPLGPSGYEWIAKVSFTGALIFGCFAEHLFGKYLAPRGILTGRDTGGGFEEKWR